MTRRRSKFRIDRVTRPFVAFLPAIVLTFWALTYFRGLILMLLAPGVPVRLRLHTPGGELQLNADSLAIAPRKGFVFARNISLTGPNNKQILYASTLSITGLEAFAPSTSAIHVRASGITGTLNRLADGKFEFQKYLPAPKQPSTPTPTSIDLSNSVIHVNDHRTNQQFDLLASSVQGFFYGDNWEVRTLASVPQVGKTSVSIRSYGDGTLEVSGESQVQNGLVAVQEARSFLGDQLAKNLATLRPSSLSAQANWHLVVAPNQPLKLLANGAINGSGSYQNQSFSSVRASGLLCSNGFAGETEVASGKSVADGSGQFAWKSGKNSSAANPVTGSGRLALHLASMSDLPAFVRKVVPSDLKFGDSTFNGSVQFIDGQPAMNGSLVTSNLQRDQLKVGHATAEVALLNNQLWLHNVRAELPAASGSIPDPQASVPGKPSQLTGALYVQLKQQEVQAAATLDSGNLLALVHGAFPKLKVPYVDLAEGHAYLLAQGAVHNPELAYRARLNAEVTVPDSVQIDHHRFAISNLLAVGTGPLDDLTFQQVTAGTSLGPVIGTGSYSVKTGKVLATAEGRGLRLSRLSEATGGFGSVKVHATGTLSHIQVEGEAEGYDLTVSGKPLELISSPFAMNNQGVMASDLEAILGGSAIHGNLGYQFNDQSLSGSITAPALQLSDLFGDSFLGPVSLKISNIGGTIAHPAAHLYARTSGITANNATIDEASATAELADDWLTVSQADIHTADGNATGTGKFNIQSGDGSGSVSANNLNISQLLLLAPTRAPLQIEGQVSGTAQVEAKDFKLASLVSNGRIASTSFEGSPIGSGLWAINSDGKLVKGNVQVSQEDTFLSIENATYDLDSKNYGGEFIASKVPIEKIVSAAMPLLSDQQRQDYQELNSLSGLAQVDLLVSGNGSQYNFGDSLAELESLSFRGEKFGDTRLNFTKQGPLWNVSQAGYTDGPTVMSGTGSYNTDTLALAANGDINNFALEKISNLFPKIPHLSGNATASFVASGTTKAPVVRASLDASNLVSSPGAAPFGLNLDEITADNSGIHASGGLSYRGIVGAVSLFAPYQFPFTISTDIPSSFSLTLASRPVQDLAEFIPELKDQKINGEVSGVLALNGPINHLTPTGKFHVSADQLGGNYVQPQSKKEVKVQTAVKDLDFTVSIDGNNATVQGSAASSLGGTLSLAGTVGLQPINDVLDGTAGTDITAHLLQTPVDLKLKSTRFRVSQKDSEISVASTIDSDLAISGVAQAPAVTGKVALSNSAGTIPAFNTASGSSAPPKVNPTFNVAFNLDSPFQIESSLARIGLLGDGTLTGNLSAPQFNSNLTVANGSLRLPGGTVYLEKGGTVNAIYQGGRNGQGAQVNLDVHGSTHIVAVKNGDIPTRYDVSVDIIGDLLDQKNLTFFAYSDPPDLTQDEIISLLGRTDLLSTISGRSGQGDASQQFQTALAGYALPAFLDPITSQIAKGFSLDYVSLDYDRYGQTSVTIAKTLGLGFVLSYRRLISEPAPGFPLTYDLRLSYRLPSRAQLLRRFSAYVGLDQDHPWKFSIEYNTRF